MDLVGSIFNGVAASFGTSCIAGRNHITYGHEDGDVYQFENDRVVELPFFFLFMRQKIGFCLFYRMRQHGRTGRL